MSTTFAAADAARDELTGFGGDLIGRDDPGFADAKKIFNAFIDKNPALIARPATADDVAAAIAFARRHSLPLAVRGGAHNGAGLGTCDDGVVIDLGRFKDIAVDADAKTVTVGGGCVWGEVDQATNAFGLATPSGIISTTGVGGLTLGGGLGHLTRKYGLSIDNLLGADIVLADGRQVRADADNNPDLFWAIRGGGGNFGVVTSFTFRLHPMDGVVAGPIFYPRDRAAEALRQFREITASAPDDQTTFFALLSSPEGAPMVGFITVSASADPAVAAPTHDKILELGPPLADMVGPMPYVVLQSMLDEGMAAGLPVYWKAHFLNGLDDAAIDQIVDWGNRADSPVSLVLIEHLGGAVARVPAHETAFAHRHAAYNIAIIGRWLDPDGADATIAWTRGFHDALTPFAAGVYMNYLGVGDSGERVREAYDEDVYARLVALKRAYDPENLFHRNQNIRPA